MTDTDEEGPGNEGPSDVSNFHALRQDAGDRPAFSLSGSLVYTVTTEEKQVSPAHHHIMTVLP